MWPRGVRSLHRKFSSSSEGRDVVIHNRNAAVPHLLPHHPYSAPSPIPTAHSNFRLCCASAALLSLTAGATVLVFPRGGEEEEEDEHHGHGRANLQPHIAKFNNRLERIAEVISERSKSAYAHALETGVAAMVLFRSLRSVLSSANQDARLGLDSWLKFRVAALLADLSGANESRRTAIVHAGGGAVVDWLLESVSVPSVTQPEAARALSYLISDAATCETVLGRPHAISHLFRFIYSLHPQSVKQQKKTKVLHDTAEVLKGKSMLVAAIMDVVTSSCDNPDTKIFRARLPEDADSGDIVAALQVIEEGGLQLDGPHDHDDEGDDRTGVRGIGIKILGGTTIIGALSLEDFLPDFFDSRSL